MSKKILITGGAGFVGSHLADKLIEQGDEVRVFDCLASQVHGVGISRPLYLSQDIDLINGDICSYSDVKKALKGIDVVFHFAAAIGVGQSMYEIQHYTAVNSQGTAVLLEAIAQMPIVRLIVASSMSIYGEGLYRDSFGNKLEHVARPVQQLKNRQWDLLDTNGVPLQPMPTPETKFPNLSSIYAITKYIQERMCLTIGEAYKIPTVALRFFNIYGTRQALSNPYTGVLAIFASRLLNNRPLIIHEDGLQKRDFVHVSDIVQACCLALEAPNLGGLVMNIGSGKPYSIREVGRQMAIALGKEHLSLESSGTYRIGDIRNCFADISLAERVLGYKPAVSLQKGLSELVEWVEQQSAIDFADRANRELLSRGLAA